MYVCVCAHYAVCMLRLLDSVQLKFTIILLLSFNFLLFTLYIHFVLFVFTTSCR